MARCWRSELVTFSDIVRALLERCSAQQTVALASTSLLAVASEHCPTPPQSPRQPPSPFETAECVLRRFDVPSNFRHAATALFDDFRRSAPGVLQ